MARSAGAALLGLGLLLAAAAFDSPSLNVPGVALLALGAGAGAWVRLAARGARLRRTLGPPAVEEEQPYPLRLRLSAGWLPLPGGELREPLLAEPIRLGGLRPRRVRVEVRFGRRGRREIGPARLVVRDPLWLAVAERDAGEPGEVVVLPRVEPVRAAGGGPGDGLAQPGAAAPAAASELELDALAPYREGAPASRIHWPTVARSGELVERRLVPDCDARPLVVLDARCPASPEALDSAVRAAASLTVHLARAGGCVVLLPGDRRPAEVGPDLRAWPGMHMRLALLEPSGEAPATARLQRAGTIFWVAAAAAERPPPGLDRCAAAARYLVTPGERADGAAFTVAGCAGRRLASRGRVAA